MRVPVAWEEALPVPPPPALAEAREAAEVVGCAVAGALCVPPGSVEGEGAALALAMASAVKEGWAPVGVVDAVANGESVRKAEGVRRALAVPPPPFPSLPSPKALRVREAEGEAVGVEATVRVEKAEEVASAVAKEVAVAGGRVKVEVPCAERVTVREKEGRVEDEIEWEAEGEREKEGEGEALNVSKGALEGAALLEASWEAPEEVEAAGLALLLREPRPPALTVAWATEVTVKEGRAEREPPLPEEVLGEAVGEGGRVAREEGEVLAVGVVSAFVGERGGVKLASGPAEGLGCASVGDGVGVGSMGVEVALVEGEGEGVSRGGEGVEVALGA